MGQLLRYVCTISLAIDDGELRVIVDDNGRGIRLGASQSHGLGLIAMRERAQAQGGSLTIMPMATGGTRVAVVLAVPALAHEAV